MIDAGKLRDLMRAGRIQGKDLADKAGCSRVTISRIRNGRQGVSRDLAERIAAALGVPLSEFRRESPAGSLVGLAGLSRQCREVLEAMERLGESDRNIAWAFVKGLVASRSSSGAEAAAALEAAAQGAERVGEEQADRKARRA